MRFVLRSFTRQSPLPRIDPLPPVMQLVKTDDGRRNDRAAQNPPSDYVKRRTYRKVDQLLFRILQLDEILHKDSTFKPEKAARLKAQIEEAQHRIEQLYVRIDGRALRRVSSSRD